MAIGRSHRPLAGFSYGAEAGVHTQENKGANAQAVENMKITRRSALLDIIVGGIVATGSGAVGIGMYLHKQEEHAKAESKRLDAKFVSGRVHALENHITDCLKNCGIDAKCSYSENTKMIMLCVHLPDPPQRFGKQDNLEHLDESCLCFLAEILRNELGLHAKTILIEDNPNRRNYTLAEGTELESIDLVTSDMRRENTIPFVMSSDEEGFRDNAYTVAWEMKSTVSCLEDENGGISDVPIVVVARRGRHTMQRGISDETLATHVHRWNRSEESVANDRNMSAIDVTFPRYYDIEDARRTYNFGREMQNLRDFVEKFREGIRERAIQNFIALSE